MVLASFSKIDSSTPRVQVGNHAERPPRNDSLFDTQSSGVSGLFATNSLTNTPPSLTTLPEQVQHRIFSFLDELETQLVLATKLMFVRNGTVDVLATHEEDAYKEYGIVFLAPPHVQEESKRFIRIVCDHFPQLVVKKNNYHITLFHLKCAKADVPLIYQKLRTLKLSPVQVDLAESVFNQGDQYVVWQVYQNPVLAEMHETTVNAIAPYRHGALQRSQDAYNKLDSTGKAHVDQYGVCGVFSTYNPHITLFYGDNPVDNLDSAVSQIIPGKEHTKFIANTVVIGELGYLGNLENVLYSVELD